MLIVYILILVLLIANLKSFISVFFKNGFNNSEGNKYLSLNTFVEPITRSFNAFKYKDFNSIHGIK